MKKGFSFAEVFATMMVIGIISTLALPVITRTADKQNKQLYKSAVEKLNTIVVELINDVNAYPVGELTTETQFCTDFSAKLNLIGTATCATSATIPTTPSFTTTNGMKWYFLAGSFNTTCPNTSNDNCLLMHVDVNGNKGKNSQDVADGERRDILSIYVSTNGKIYVPNGLEKDYMMN